MKTVVETARKWLGYLEHENNSLLGVYRANAGKGGYTAFAQIIAEEYKWRNFGGLPWCAVFVYAVFIQALGKRKARELLGKPHPGTRVLARRMKRQGRWREREYTPNAGDIIFCTNTPDGMIGHCGIVETVINDTVVTIDGNTVDPSGVFDREQGGAVARRERCKDDPVIVGYAAMKG